MADTPSASPTVTPNKLPASALFLVRMTVGLALLAGGAATANWLLRNWIPLSADLAAEHPEWGAQARMKVPLLPSEGKDRARLPLVVAWDPASPASTRLVGWLLARSEQEQSLVAQSRLVRLVQAAPDFDPQLLDLLGAMDHRDVLQPALREGRLALPLSLLGLNIVAGDDARSQKLLARDAADADIRQWIRTQARVAEGLGLQPGDVLLQGRRVPIAQLHSEAALDQELAVAQSEWQKALDQAGGKADVVRTGILQKMLERDPAAAERFKAWVIDGVKVKTAMGM